MPGESSSVALPVSGFDSKPITTHSFSGSPNLASESRKLGQLSPIYGVCWKTGNVIRADTTAQSAEV
jgi:hypothetical protein